MKETTEVRYFYLRRKNRVPIGVVAYHKVENTSKVSFNLSVVHPTDEFLKERGRDIAHERLFKRPMNIILDSPDVSNFAIVNELMRALATNKSLPSKARKAALIWLKSTDT